VESETGGETERRSDELEGIDGRELGDKGLEKVFELGADWQATSRGGLFESSASENAELADLEVSFG
jgi:hypothetical protein